MGLDEDRSPAIPPLTEDGQRRLNIGSLSLFNSEAGKAVDMVFIEAAKSIYHLEANANLARQTPIMIAGWAQGMVRLCFTQS